MSHNNLNKLTIIGEYKMALSSFELLKSNFNLKQSLSADATNSDATLVIDGFDNLFIKIKSFPDPTSNIAESIEVPMPLGNTYDKPGQRKSAFSGSASFIETEDRTIEKMLRELNDNGGYFDATLYQGTPTHHVNRKRLINCFFVQTAPVQRDFSSNTEVLTIEGDFHGNYFGEFEEGNTSTLMGG